MKRMFFAVLTLLCLVGCSTTINAPNIENNIIDNQIIDKNITIEEDKNVVIDENLDAKPLEIHFIDVGQADCILIKSEDGAMLIDAGNNDDSNIIKNYLTNEKIEKLKYVIGTHPHEDHIGSLDVVINEFDIENVIMPRKSTTTKTFEDVVKAIENKKLSIIAPKVGDKFKLGKAEFEIIAPIKSDYGDNLNNYSVGIILTYGENRFVFTGDAEESVENDILSANLDINADLFKLGHHGSSTSNSKAFLDKISPQVAIIMCGVDNSYGHPHKEIVDEIIRRDIKLYRTDLQGNIKVTSDGKNIEVETDKEIKVEIEESYILNINSKVFHYFTCDSVAKMADKNKKTYIGKREDLLFDGYKACGICRP